MPAQNSEQIIVFGLRGNSFGLELDRVESIIEKSTVYPVPNAPYIAEGIVLYRNNVLPVINLLRLLGADDGGVGDFVVVVRGVAEDFGFSSDRIYGIASADRLNLKLISLEERKNRFIQGTGEMNGVEFSFLEIGNLG